MKILILHSSPNLRSILLDWIQQNTRHIASADDFDDVALSVACFEPDIVLLPQYSEAQALFPNVRFCELPEEFDTEIGSDHPLPRLLKHAERIQRLLRIPAHGYAGNSLRVILSAEVSCSNPKETPRAVRRTLDGGNQYEGRQSYSISSRSPPNTIGMNGRGVIFLPCGGLTVACNWKWLPVSIMDLTGLPSYAIKLPDG